MAAFKPCVYKWENLRAGDVFFSHGADPLGGLIRFGESPKLKSLVNRALPNHAGFLYEIRGQWFAAEVGGTGIRLNSLDKYRKENNQIIGLIRWHGFDDGALLRKWEEDMAEWIRRSNESGYDWIGAVRASPFVRRFLPFLKNKAGKEFCSEDVYVWLRKYGQSATTMPLTFPLAWEKYPPNPLQLSGWLGSRSSCTNIPEKDFKEYTK